MTNPKGKKRIKYTLLPLLPVSLSVIFKALDTVSPSLSFYKKKKKLNTGKEKEKGGGELLRNPQMESLVCGTIIIIIILTPTQTPKTTTIYIYMD